MVHWFQGSFPDGCLGDEVLTGDLSLGLISEVLGGVVIVSSQVFGHLNRLRVGSRLRVKCFNALAFQNGFIMQN